MRQKKMRKTAEWQASTRLSFSSRSVGARDSQWAGAGCRPWSRHTGLGSRPGGKKMQLIKDQTATVGMGNIQPKKSSIFEWTLPSATLFKPWCLQFKILLLNCLTCLSYLHKEWKATWQTGSTPHNYGAAPGFLNSNNLRADIQKLLFHQSSRIQLLRCCTHCPKLTDISVL